MINYQKELEKIIKDSESKGEVPSLLLHVCCAPCSSYCLEYLSQFFRITVLFYNPNIYPENEYAHRAAEAKRLIGEMVFKNEVSFKPFYRRIKLLWVKGFFDKAATEGGERCFKCYELR